MSAQKTFSPHSWKDLRLQGLISVIGCVCLFGMTFSLYSPLLSLILEQRGASNFLIGSLATTPAIGVMLGAFFVPLCLKMAGGRTLLLIGVFVEIFLIVWLMLTDKVLVWFVIRFLGGISGSIVFIVSETWLNDITPERLRGRVIGLYNTMLGLSFAIGPVVLAMTGIQGQLPFLVGIGLMSVAIVPLLLVKSYSPDELDTPTFNIVSFIKVAPLLVIACFVVAFKDMASVGLLPVYGVRSGLSDATAALMLFFAAIGGAVLQFPIGWLGDYFSRVGVMVLCGLVGIAGAAVLPFVVTVPWLLFLTLFIWLGFFAGVYTIALTLAGQWFRGTELAIAIASFGVFWGMGGLAGPIIAGYTMDLWGTHGFPLVMGVVATLFVAFCMVPSWRRAPRTAAVVRSTR
ncbi:MAG TPA: MFS transporter [Gammaproteobacteria bacterium]|nr:MFS transporter [Gammaproteobacteria bacterium]HIB07000.1 MFS transporter [Gammaproteobacteria bacterium]HIB82497.1 MFS transporter [Gammaproteobacteria bacterium]HIO17553.1 MFS transporter [Gammaproteobacteria bacterium]